MALQAANLAVVKAVGAEPLVRGVIVTLPALSRAFERRPRDFFSLSLSLQMVCHGQRLQVKRAGCVRLSSRRRHLPMLAVRSKQIFL